MNEIATATPADEPDRLPAVPESYRLRVEVTPQDMIRQKKAIAEITREVLQRDVHYGASFPGDTKQNLLQPGADALIVAFGLTPRFAHHREDFHVDGEGAHREYTVTCTLYSRSGIELGAGIGSCSTMESKYRWRNSKPTCPECGKDTVIKGKREYGGGYLCFEKKGGCGAKWPDGAREIESQVVGKVPNPDIADVYNTVLKIASKRAKVAATILVTGCADVFTQDVEDLMPRGEAPPEEPKRTVVKEPAKPAPAPVQAKPNAAPAAAQVAADANATADLKAKCSASLAALRKVAGKEFADRVWNHYQTQGLTAADAQRVAGERLRAMNDAGEAIHLVITEGGDVADVTGAVGLSVPDAVVALRKLAGMPGTGVAVDSSELPF